MSLTLQTSHYFQEPEDPRQRLAKPADPNNPLLKEMGWSEVQRGLGRILIGYFLFVVAYALAGIVLYFALAGVVEKPKSKNAGNTLELILTLAIGIAAVGSIVSYGLVISGKWRCIMNAPERHGAKWLMFACLLCLLVSPVLNLVTGFTGEGSRNYKAMQHGREGMRNITFESVSAKAQLCSFGLGLASVLFFVLFLRSVASCFNSQVCIWAVHLYLLYSCLLIGISVQMVLGAGKHLPGADMLVAVGLGWLLSAVWYAGLVFSVRRCISNGLANLRAPLSAR